MSCKHRLRHDCVIHSANKEIKHKERQYFLFQKTKDLSTESETNTQQLGNVDAFQCFMNSTWSKNYRFCTNSINLTSFTYPVQHTTIKRK